MQLPEPYFFHLESTPLSPTLSLIQKIEHADTHLNSLVFPRWEYVGVIKYTDGAPRTDTAPHTKRARLARPWALFRSGWKDAFLERKQGIFGAQSGPVVDCGCVHLPLLIMVPTCPNEVLTIAALCCGGFIRCIILIKYFEYIFWRNVGVLLFSFPFCPPLFCIQCGPCRKCIASS